MLELRHYGYALGSLATSQGHGSNPWATQHAMSWYSNGTRSISSTNALVAVTLLLPASRFADLGASDRTQLMHVQDICKDTKQCGYMH